MPQLASGWSIEAKRGPQCLFVKLHRSGEQEAHSGELANQLWQLLRRHLTYGLVIELDEFEVLRSSVIGDLIILQKRIQQHGGLMRLCGLPEPAQQTLRAMQLESWLPQYQTREAALMGLPPNQPR